MRVGLFLVGIWLISGCTTLGADCRRWEYTDTSFKQKNGRLYKYDEAYCKEFK